MLMTNFGKEIKKLQMSFAYRNQHSFKKKITSKLSTGQACTFSFSHLATNYYFGNFCTCIGFFTEYASLCYWKKAGISWKLYVWPAISVVLTARGCGPECLRSYYPISCRLCNILKHFEKQNRKTSMGQIDHF